MTLTIWWEFIRQPYISPSLNQDSVVVYDSLFSELIDFGKFIDPLKIKENNYLLMELEDWNYQPAINKTDVQLQYHEVEKKIGKKYLPAG